MTLIAEPLSFAALGTRLGMAVFLLSCLASATMAAVDARVENARRAFAILDMNGDQKITNVEFENRKIKAFSAPDRNQDNSLSEDEVLITPEQFGKIDRNADGKISGGEFIDSPYGQFESYDADKNGTVDLQELTRILAGQ